MFLRGKRVTAYHHVVSGSDFRGRCQRFLFQVPHGHFLYQVQVIDGGGSVSSMSCAGKMGTPKRINFITCWVPLETYVLCP